MTRLFNRVPPSGADPRAIATELNRIIEHLENRARIFGLSQILPGVAIPAGAWTAIGLTNLIAAFPAVNMRLGTGAEVGRLIYTGAARNALEFHASMSMEWTGAANVQVSFRKNGDDGTVEPIFATLAKEVFEIGMVGAFDVVENDYVELVVNPSIAITATASLSFYARNAPIDTL